MGSGEEVGIAGLREAIDRRRLIRGSMEEMSMAVRFQIIQSERRKGRKDENCLLYVGMIECKLFVHFFFSQCGKPSGPGAIFLNLGINSYTT